MTPATLSGHSAAPGQPEHELRDPAPGRRAGTGWVVLTGVVAGVAGALAMALWLMFCAEVANDPTPVAGIDSSTWTPLTGIWCGGGEYPGGTHGAFTNHSRPVSSVVGRG